VKRRERRAPRAPASLQRHRASEKHGRARLDRNNQHETGMSHHLPAGKPALRNGRYDGGRYARLEFILAHPSASAIVSPFKLN
jgi:hypothetical protein